MSKRADCDTIVKDRSNDSEEINKTGKNSIIEKDLSHSRSNYHQDTSTSSGPINVEDVDIKEIKDYEKFLSILSKSPVYNIMSTDDKQLIKEIFNCEATL